MEKSSTFVVTVHFCVGFVLVLCRRNCLTLKIKCVTK